ncbi:MAG: LCP family protein [Clostridia bacterium]|nr:LCP family protein [Clostridium sp.]
MNKKSENKSKNIKNKKPKKKNKKLRIILLVILLVLIILGGVFAYKTYKNGGGLGGMLATVAGHDENTKKNLGTFQVLLMGVSTDQAGVNLTDTIMVASYDPNKQEAVLISVPRDSYTGTNTKKATAAKKINALYNVSGDPQETLDAVNNLTGLDIKYYAIIKTEALIELVNAIGPIEYNVPINMDYDDVTQDLHIHLKAGVQQIDGKKAEHLLRFRHNNNGTSYPSEYGDNDIGRMRTQREFITAVISQTVKLENITKLGAILDVANRNLITNIDFKTLKDYLPYAVEFNTQNLKTASLPGSVPDLRKTNNVSIFVVDKEETQTLMQELFYKEEQEGENTAINNTGDNTTNVSTNTTKTKQKTKSEIKIEILNGSGNSKTLQNAIDKLKNKGYNVTKTGTTNATSKTTIINKKEIQESTMQDIKTTIGVGTISDSEVNSSKVDITIILGKDYK